MLIDLGWVVRDYLHAEDVALALAKLGKYRGDEYLFNIGSGEGRSLNQIIALIELILGRPVQKRYLKGRSLDVPANILDASKAEKVLGWRPSISFHDGLCRLLNAQR